MKSFVLVLIFSTATWAGFKEDYKSNIEFCNNLTKDSNKVAMVNGRWVLTKSYIAELKKDPVVSRRQMLCDVSIVFNRNFEKKHQPKFEVLAKKRLSIVDVEAIKYELLQLVYDDTPKAHADAVRELWVSIEKYYDEKMRLILAERVPPTKAPTKKPTKKPKKK
jgi:hypothetical protein